MTDTTDFESEDSEVKKPVKEVTVVQDQGLFEHDTGDIYDGFFEAKKKDKSVKMHGPGIYTTSENDNYMGTWENDRLGVRDEVIITYACGSKYKGNFKDWCYSGSGEYLYPDGSCMQCDFVENCPTGALTLTDPNGHTWLARAEPGFAWFEPVNHFYEMLEKTRETGRIRRRNRRSNKDLDTIEDDPKKVKSSLKTKSAK